MRTDDLLLERVPGPRRCALECALVVGLVFLPSLLSTRGGPLPRLAGVELAWIVGRWLVVMAAVAVIVVLDGQSARHLGLGASRLGRELAWGAPALAGAFAAHLLVTLPVAVLMQLAGTAGGEAAQRLGAMQGLLRGVQLWQLLPALVLLAAFEEVVFRGFLLPRLRRLTGRWWLAVLLAQILFGLGHLYEGTFAVTQTMMLGVYFSVVFLWRGHLGAPIAAHAAFNSIMFGLVIFLQRSGLLDRLPQLR